MPLFFACVTLAGSVIVLLTLILMLAEKKRFHDYRQDAVAKMDDLIQMIEDAESLIKEMNKFSDYAVTKVEEKNKALKKIIHEADRRIEALSGLLDSTPMTFSDLLQDDMQAKSEDSKDKDIDLLRHSQPTDSNRNENRDISYDDKRQEIVKLKESGMDSAEIAKRLNMGRGEIELIAKIGR